MSKFYTKEWFLKYGYEDMKDFSTWEAAGDAEEVFDAIKDLISNYKSKHGFKDAEHLYEEIDRVWNMDYFVNSYLD